MRLWSIHPRYLDAKGLVALWREGLLAKAVLEGKTKGYKNHPQLDRFKHTKNPVSAINQYLWDVAEEAVCRGYNFDNSKLRRVRKSISIQVTRGQLEFEFQHLKKKLQKRDKVKLREVATLASAKPHPMFRVVKGKVEEWEKI